MKLPAELLDSLSGVKGFDRDTFIRAHEIPEKITSIRINPEKNPGFISGMKVPWSDFGYYLEERPSFTYDPLFHAGAYYVQEASSMFLEQAFRQLLPSEESLKVVDISAAPGGKSTHILSLLNEKSFLVSNETIQSRSMVLKENLVKWGHLNIVVTQDDPSAFKKLGNYFDVMVVDAPCSGSGLFRRDPEAIGEWSTGNVQLCSQRQRRILADAWSALKQDGILVYSTCSYSPDEDEAILDWLLNEFSIETCRLELDPRWKITEVKTPSSLYAYRFWPDKTKGEGFFLACLRKTGSEGGPKEHKPKKKIGLSKHQQSILSGWINSDGLEIFIHGKKVYAWPIEFSGDFNFLLENLHVIYSGVMIGEFAREKFIPSHELAMTGLVRAEVPRLALSGEEAIRFLKKQDFHPLVKTTGWHLVTYSGFNLGWVNILPNRINNYYPKSLRILR